ncbi:MAG TPA: redoxin family protein [Gemmataceae bacterium]|nr:redoxin family protein [Gemmataceae bacterium]
MNRPFRRTITLAALLVLAAAAPADDRPKPVAIGDKAPTVDQLRDLRGGRRPLAAFAGHKAVVLAFLGADCPVSNLYLPGLLELEKEYRTKDVLFLAVYPNEPDDADRAAGHAADRDVPFLVLNDYGQRLADAVGVTRVPSVAVLDGDLKLKYRGRVDDQYGVAAKRPKASRADLAEALSEVVAGKPVTTPETDADGCLIGRNDKRVVKPGVTFAKDVAPILQRRCEACHRDGQTAPFTLSSYDDAVKHAAGIKEVTAQRRMPPWHADSRFGKFTNDRHLSKAEIETLAAWVDGGKARGGDQDLPKPVAWAKGWVHGQPDHVFTMTEEFEVPATGVLPYKNWIIETGFTEDKWVTVAEARPGAPEVVHHVVAYILREGTNNPIGPDGNLGILVGWAPGDLGLVCPPDTALRIPKGARLRLEMHYTPNGTKTKDRSSVGVKFADKPPKYELLMNEFANMGFEIPGGSQHHRAEATFRIRADARLISLTPHMHWRGKDYMYEVVFPDGKKETLLSVPRWDFNWQNMYRFAEPVKLPKGSRLHAVAHWDNSALNPLNPDPKQTIRFGLQTWDEMMVGFAAYVWERPETAQELAKNPPSLAEQLFDRIDTNGDDFITPDEVPDRFKLMLAGAGFPADGKMSREEFLKRAGELINRFGKKGPGPKKDEKKPE